MKPPKSSHILPEPDGIARLIRARRAELDWSLAKLARASGLRSPAFVFHIENGTKTPSVAVARRLAAALDLDTELLSAWAMARGRANLGNALAASATLRRWLGDGDGATPPQRTPPPGAGEEEPMPVRAGPLMPPPSDMIDVPVLPDGADPAAGPIAPRTIETLRLDRALFPPLEANARLVGYRLSAHGARRIPELLRPGDCVVVLLDGDPPGPDTPCAVRVGSRVEIVRVRVHDGTVHLPPAADAKDSERSDPRNALTNAADIAGRVVLVFRRWL